MICKYCSKECKNSNSLRNHERLCKLNPNRQLTTYEKYGPVEGFNNLGRSAWNKGLTKFSDERVSKISTSVKANNELQKESGIFEEKHSHPCSEETKSKLRDYALSVGFGGMHRNKNSIIYKEVKLNSTYELITAMSLDKEGIIWEKPKRLSYTDDNGKYHTYTADFYLPEYDVFLDPKNDFLINNINPSLGF